MKKSVLVGLCLAAVVIGAAAYWWVKERGKVTPEQVRENFMISCEDAVRSRLAGPGEQPPADAVERGKAYCECAFSSVLKRFTMEEFVDMDKAMRASGTIDPSVQKRLTEAVNECHLDTPGAKPAGQ